MSRSERPYGPKRRPALGYVLMSFSIVLLCGFVVGFFSLNNYLFGDIRLGEGGAAPALMLFYGGATLVITAIGWWSLVCAPIHRMGRRFLLVRVGDILASDHRAPVLYLRKFETERKVRHEERIIAHMLRDVGPFIALGQ